MREGAPETGKAKQQRAADPRQRPFQLTGETAMKKFRITLALAFAKLIGVPVKVRDSYYGATAGEAG
jgi:hypothetical protein